MKKKWRKWLPIMLSLTMICGSVAPGIQTYASADGETVVQASEVSEDEEAEKVEQPESTGSSEKDKIPSYEEEGENPEEEADKKETDEKEDSIKNDGEGEKEDSIKNNDADKKEDFDADAVKNQLKMNILDNEILKGNPNEEIMPLAATSVQYGSLTITGDSAALSSGVTTTGGDSGYGDYILISTSSPLTISGTASNTYNIWIAAGTTANLTLNNVTITESSYADSPINLLSGSTCNLTLQGTNTLTTSGVAAAALHVGQNCTLTV